MSEDQDWVVVGFYCKGREGDRHKDQPVRYYRRRMTELDGTYFWTQLHSDPSRADGKPLRETRTWTDPGEGCTEFWCPRCIRNVRKQWHEIQPVLDNAVATNQTKLPLERWYA